MNVQGVFSPLLDR